jgi:hypothetical protein
VSRVLDFHHPSLSIKPWEQIYTKISAGTREDYRRQRELEASNDAEIESTEIPRDTTESAIGTIEDDETEIGNSEDSEDGIVEADGIDLANYLGESNEPIDAEVLVSLAIRCDRSIDRSRFSTWALMP